MAEKDSHTKGPGDLEPQVCHCGNLISGRDPHKVSLNSLGLENAHQAVDHPVLCRLCLVFTMKRIQQRLAYQASLSGLDPCLSSTTPGMEEEKKWADAAETAPPDSAITVLCLPVQLCAVQATGIALVLQEHAQLLNLARLSDRERDDVLDKPIVPEEIFSSALASMERCCKTKKKQGKALYSFLPVRPMAHPQTTPTCGSPDLTVPNPEAGEAR